MWNYQRQENTISEMSPFMGNFNNRLKKRSLNLKIWHQNLSKNKHKEHTDCKAFDQLYNFKWSNICSQSPRRRGERVERKNIQRRNGKKFPNLVEIINPQIQRWLTKVHHNQVLKISNKVKNLRSQRNKDTSRRGDLK